MCSEAWPYLWGEQAVTPCAACASRRYAREGLARDRVRRVRKPGVGAVLVEAAGIGINPEDMLERNGTVIAAGDGVIGLAP